MEKLTAGSYINWAEPKANANEMTGEYCIQCGRKTSANSYMINVSIYGQVIPINQMRDSQGFWSVGSECAKKFDADLLQKVGA